MTSASTTPRSMGQRWSQARTNRAKSAAGVSGSDAATAAKLDADAKKLQTINAVAGVLHELISLGKIAAVIAECAGDGDALALLFSCATRLVPCQADATEAEAALTIE